MMANVMVGIAGNVNFFVVVVVDVVINVDVVKIVITHLARLARVEGIAVVVVVRVVENISLSYLFKVVTKTLFLIAVSTP